MSTTTINLAKNPDLDAAAKRVLEAAHDYWKEANRALGTGAVVWLEDTDGRLLVFTRGEYRQAIARAVVDASGDQRSFVVHTWPTPEGEDE